MWLLLNTNGKSIIPWNLDEEQFYELFFFLVCPSLLLCEKKFVVSSVLKPTELENVKTRNI